MPPRTLFLADLHLSPRTPALNAHFAAFLTAHQGQVDALYILGDLFGFWLGDDDSRPFARTIQTQLATFARHTPLFIVSGNRDFLLGAPFARATGATLLADPSVVTLYGQAYVLAHGDALCTEDKTYQRFRRVVRCGLTQWLFLRLPLAWRQRLAGDVQRESGAAKVAKPYAVTDVSESAVLALLARYPEAHLIHGHTHRPACHTYATPQGARCRWVIADCRAEVMGGYVQVDASGVAAKTWLGGA